MAAIQPQTERWHCPFVEEHSQEQDGTPIYLVERQWRIHPRGHARPRIGDLVLILDDWETLQTGKRQYRTLKVHDCDPLFPERIHNGQRWDEQWIGVLIGKQIQLEAV